MTIRSLELAQGNSPGQALLRSIAGNIPDQHIELFGLTFPNVLGVAAGFDKNASIIPGLGILGFGHIEVGTVTPRPQAGNPQPRIFRLLKDKAIINQMGFPNVGAQVVAERLGKLAEFERDFILGVSLGKQKETPLNEAVDDYIHVMGAVYPYADYLVINISSPNTPELRNLQTQQYINDLLSRLMFENDKLAKARKIARRPLLLKIDPDLTQNELDIIIEAALSSENSGIVATNTTISRSGLESADKVNRGGLSGRPLVKKSNEIISYINKRTEGNLPVIGVGGVFDADDVLLKIRAGASLVQIYTGLVYKGPRMAGRILRQLK